MLGIVVVWLWSTSMKYEHLQYRTLCQPFACHLLKTHPLLLQPPSVFNLTSFQTKHDPPNCVQSSEGALRYANLVRTGSTVCTTGAALPSTRWERVRFYCLRLATLLYYTSYKFTVPWTGSNQHKYPLIYSYCWFPLFCIARTSRK